MYYPGITWFDLLNELSLSKDELRVLLCNCLKVGGKQHVMVSSIVKLLRG